MKKQNETSYKKTKSKTATTSKNASRPLNVQSQPRKLPADQGLEKEEFELFRAENTSQKVNKSTNANETLQEQQINFQTLVMHHRKKQQINLETLVIDL